MTCNYTGNTREYLRNLLEIQGLPAEYMSFSLSEIVSM